MNPTEELPETIKVLDCFTKDELQNIKNSVVRHGLAAMSVIAIDNDFMGDVPGSR